MQQALTQVQAIGSESENVNLTECIELVQSFASVLQSTYQNESERGETDETRNSRRKVIVKSTHPGTNLYSVAKAFVTYGVQNMTRLRTLCLTVEFGVASDRRR